MGLIVANISLIRCVLKDSSDSIGFPAHFPMRIFTPKANQFGTYFLLSQPGNIKLEDFSNRICLLWLNHIGSVFSAVAQDIAVSV